jgi:hypothetical protein
MLCAFALAKCDIKDSETCIFIFCFDDNYKFYGYMDKSGGSLTLEETFNDKTVELRYYNGSIGLEPHCYRTEKDKYGVKIKEEQKRVCKTPGEKWKEFREEYNF